MNSVMNNDTDKRLKRLEDDTEFEEFEDYGKLVLFRLGMQRCK